MSGEGHFRNNEITALLDAVADGDTRAATQLLAVTYQDVKRLAEYALQCERSDHTLQPTALAHEVVQRFLTGKRLSELNDSEHYYNSIRQVIRHVLIDYERKRQAIKRGVNLKKHPLHSSCLATYDHVRLPLYLLDLLDQLAMAHPRPCKVFTLHAYEGLHHNEIAVRLGISLSTVESDYKLAKGWLHRALKEKSE